VADGGGGDGDAVADEHGVAEGGSEAAFFAGVLGAGLRVVGDAPGGAVEGGDHVGLGCLGDLAVVGGVGLAGDEKDLADTDVLDLKQCDGVVAVDGSKLDCVEAT
jgi:hypothetical protein